MDNVNGELETLRKCQKEILEINKKPTIVIEMKNAFDGLV